MFAPYLTLPLPFAPTSLAFEPASGVLAYENQSLAEVSFKFIRKDDTNNSTLKLNKSAPAFRRNALSWHKGFLAVLEEAGNRLTLWDVANMRMVFQYVANPQTIRCFSVDADRRQVLIVLGQATVGQVALPNGEKLPKAMLFALDDPANPQLLFRDDLILMSGCLVSGSDRSMHLFAHRESGSKQRELVHLYGEDFDHLTVVAMDVIDATQTPGVVYMAAAEEGYVVFYGESLQGRLLYQFREGFWIRDRSLEDTRVLGLAAYAGTIVGLLEKDDSNDGYLIQDMIMGKVFHHSQRGLPACFAANGETLIVGADEEVAFFRSDA